ncbi:uncharacterized protein LOC131658956 [Vicia villosa]|uniref:uncharacterized protein LOC131658956 n=1 Tax=Vicia villosa TaxID=3911 RepID=UPI00273AB10F|nr:uncharacterized protein LOC131658956 [Vicia villosa]
MANNVDFKVDRANVERYKIKCRNHDCGFRLHASYRKRSDSWVIGYISQDHTCVNTNVSQDHRKLSYDIICQEILHLVDKDPSLKVKTIISHIVSTYNYTLSYRKAWLAKTKAIELVYGNWEDSYKRLPRFLFALQIYSPGTVTILETLRAQSPDGTCLQGNVIFHRLFWAFRPCVQGFAYCKPILQIDGTWLYGKYKETLLMAVAQDRNSNIFPVAFALVEGETAGDRHASIEIVYNNPANGWQNPPSTHVYCIHYIAQNFMREIKDNALRKTLVNSGYALTQPKFQYYRHEIVAANPDAECSYAHQDPLALLSPIYKAGTLLGVYNNAFRVMAKEDYWPAYEGDVVWHNDNMRRKKRGRPNSTQIITEMDHEKMVRKCGICREVGNNKNTCPNRGATSTNN